MMVQRARVSTGAAVRNAAGTAALAVCLLLASCDVPADRPFRVGIVNEAPVMTETMKSFRDELQRRAALAGRPVEFLYYSDASSDPSVADQVVARVLEGKPDAVVSFGRASTAAAHKALAGRGTPLVFAPGIDPVGKGYVKSLRRPGGTMTGVALTRTTDRLLQWIVKIAPSTRRVFVPTDPAVPAADPFRLEITDLAPPRGLTPICSAVPFSVAMEADLARLPAGTAILILPTPSGITGFAAAATRLGFPIFSSIPDHAGQGALFVYSYDFGQLGRQTARIMALIMQGVRAADIPVESTEFVSTINMRAARELGITIPEDVLAQVDVILR